MGREVVLAAFVLGACASDTDIVGTLSPAGERTALAVTGGITSIGLIDGWVLVTTVEPIAAPAGWPDHTLAAQAWWIDPAGATSAPIDLGWGTTSTVAPRWVRAGDRLVGTVWADPSHGGSPPDASTMITMWSFSSGGGVGCHDTPRVRVWVDPDLVTISPAGAWFDATALDPIGVAGDRAIGLASAEPGQTCQWWRLLTLPMNECSATASYVVPETRLCADPVRADDQPGNVAGVSLGDDLGVLFRPFGFADSRVRWMTLTGGTTPVGDPVTVGRFDLNSGAIAVQPRGVAIGDRVAFFETASNDGLCFALRGMARDGSGAADAPWQLPCMGHGNRASIDVDLLSLPGVGLVVAADEASDGSGDRHVYALALTGGGRRGSEIVDVAPSASGGSDRFRAAADGNDVAVVYVDDQGVWLQRLRYTTN